MCAASSLFQPTFQSDELPLLGDVVDPDEDLVRRGVVLEERRQFADLLRGLRDEEAGSFVLAELDRVGVVLDGAVDLVQAEAFHVLVAPGDGAQDFCNRVRHIPK